MGFAERSDSFDFNVALQDYTKRWKARMNPPLPAVEEDSPSPHIPSGPKKDYSLKEDQTFTISIPGRGSRPDSGLNLLGSKGSGGADHNISSAMGGSFPLLPPPPSAPKRR